MDLTDFRILQILTEDARTPFSQIAKTLGIGTDAVFRRFKQLQEKGFVQGATVILSSKSCGLQGLCGLFVKIKSGASITNIADEIKKIKQVSDFSQLWGEYDFYIQVYYRNFDEVQELIRNLRQIKGISLIDPMVYDRSDWPLPWSYFHENFLPEWAYKIEQK